MIVVAAGNPRNAAATSAHNVLGREGIPPLDLLDAGRGEARHYGAEIRRDRAIAMLTCSRSISLVAALRVRRLLLATGLIDVLPDVAGSGAGACCNRVYCHGWEARGQRIGVLGTNARAVHQNLLFRQLTDDLTLFVDRVPDPGEESWERLAAVDVRVVHGAVQRLRGENDMLRGVVLDDGREFNVDALVALPRFLARADLYERLGAALTAGTFVPTGPMGRTPILCAQRGTPAISARPSRPRPVPEPSPAIHADLVADDARAAVLARRRALV